MSQSIFKTSSQDLAFYSLATILGTTATILVGKGSWKAAKCGWSAASWTAEAAWSATKWTARNGWNVVKATPGTAWSGTKWTAETTWNATKWTAGTTWSATEWTVGGTLSIAKYIIVNIPAAIKWTGLTIYSGTKWGCSTVWSLAKWSFSCVRHPIVTVQNAFNNALSFMKATWNFAKQVCEKVGTLYEKYILDNIEALAVMSYKGAKEVYYLVCKNVQEIAQGINEQLPITGRIATSVKGYALAFFGWTSVKVTTVAKKILPYNPIAWVFKKAPSLQNPTYAAVGAAGASFIADTIAPAFSVGTNQKTFSTILKKLNLDEMPDINKNLNSIDKKELSPFNLFVITLAAAILTPRVAKYFSSHTVTRIQGTGWGMTFAAAKILLTNRAIVLKLEKKLKATWRQN